MLLRWCTFLGFLLGLLAACSREEQAGAGLEATTSTDPPSTGGPTGDPTPTDGAPDAGGTTGSTGDGGGDTTETVGTGGDVAGCGDGVVGPDEQCDDGLAENTVSGECLPDCVLASCGDGFLQEGVEQCDLGGGNSHDFGGCVPGTCHWGPNCGDGVVTPGHELCDPGAPVDPSMEVVPCTPTCRFAGRVAFLSSEVYPGDLDGVAGADLKCQLLAKPFDPLRFHTYRAWLSGGESEPAATFLHGPEFADAPYVLLNGVEVAASFEDLVANGPTVGITITDTYQAVSEAFVWTHTNHAGEAIPDAQDCEQWTSAAFDAVAMVGVNALAGNSPDAQTWADERWWTRYDEKKCYGDRHLYCFEN